MSQRRLLDQERDASHVFLDHVLREDKDKASVIHFDYEVELLQDLTSSRQKLEASLERRDFQTLEAAIHPAGTMIGTGTLVAAPCYTTRYTSHRTKSRKSSKDAKLS
jgi:hypothetical protein